MRKIALLLAAALVVSAPLIAATSTLTYAAAKAKAKPAKGKQEAPKGDPNSAFLQALSDLGNSLSQPWPAPDGGKGKAKKGKK
jgi:hypothetical protein